MFALPPWSSSTSSGPYVQYPSTENVRKGLAGMRQKKGVDKSRYVNFEIFLDKEK